MATSFNYSVLQLIPDQRRGECVNVGIIVYLADQLDVRILPSLSKVSALNGNFDLQQIYRLKETLNEWTKRYSTAEDKYASLKGFDLIGLSELGWFSAQDMESYEYYVGKLMKDLVSPVSHTHVPLAGSTRLITSLRDKFKKQGILGKEPDDIDRHLVIASYAIDEKEGLYSDFVLKNGHYHVTETADFRLKNAGATHKYRVASFAAIKLDKARMKWEDKTQQFVIYAAHGNREVLAQLNLLGEYARGGVYNIASRSEMASYMDKMMSAAGKNIHA